MLEDFENNFDIKELILNDLAHSNKIITIYLCKQCSSSILINNLFYDINKKILYLECECQCRRIKYLPINSYYKEFEYEEYKKSFDIIKINNIKCFQHKENKFDYYCINCEKDLCKNCIVEHSNHCTIVLNYIYRRNQLIEKIKKSIDIEDNNENSHNIQKDINNKSLNQENFTIKEIDIQSKKSLIKLLDNLIKFYSLYPCYNIDKSITNISKFCTNINEYIVKSEDYKVLLYLFI